MRVNLIAAVARNGVIGVNNGMPWRLPADFAWFKKHTLGHPVVMGRKTFESIGRALPGRRNLVVSRDPAWRAADCENFTSVDAALASCAREAEVFVIGGATLYNETLARAGRLFITEVDAAPEGDTRFPAWPRTAWRETYREHRDADERNVHAMDFVILERVA